MILQSLGCNEDGKQTDGSLCDSYLLEIRGIIVEILLAFGLNQLRIYRRKEARDEKVVDCCFDCRRQCGCDCPMVRPEQSESNAT